MTRNKLPLKTTRPFSIPTTTKDEFEWLKQLEWVRKNYGDEMSEKFIKASIERFK